ncbi:hypothetical protein NKH54_22640 [Mesorhizobium sp. M1004]|uniref:hypothetical protein n=1 Tax=Mesorhizobium sp. M1004 TaxID=2957046 RepID=UPI00333B5BE6
MDVLDCLRGQAALAVAAAGGAQMLIELINSRAVEPLQGNGADLWDNVLLDNLTIALQRLRLRLGWGNRFQPVTRIFGNGGHRALDERAFVDLVEALRKLGFGLLLRASHRGELGQPLAGDGVRSEVEFKAP